MSYVNLLKVIDNEAEFKKACIEHPIKLLNSYGKNNSILHYLCDKQNLFWFVNSLNNNIITNKYYRNILITASEYPKLFETIIELFPELIYDNLIYDITNEDSILITLNKLQYLKCGDKFITHIIKCPNLLYIFININNKLNKQSTRKEKIEFDFYKTYNENKNDLDKIALMYSKYITVNINDHGNILELTKNDHKTFCSVIKNYNNNNLIYSYSLYKYSNTSNLKVFDMIYQKHKKLNPAGMLANIEIYEKYKDIFPNKASINTLIRLKNEISNAPICINIILKYSDIIDVKYIISELNLLFNTNINNYSFVEKNNKLILLSYFNLENVVIGKHFLFLLKEHNITNHKIPYKFINDIDVLNHYNNNVNISLHNFFSNDNNISLSDINSIFNDATKLKYIDDIVKNKKSTHEFYSKIIQSVQRMKNNGYNISDKDCIDIIINSTFFTGNIYNILDEPILMDLLSKYDCSKPRTYKYECLLSKPEYMLHYINNSKYYVNFVNNLSTEFISSIRSVELLNAIYNTNKHVINYNEELNKTNIEYIIYKAIQNNEFITYNDYYYLIFSNFLNNFNIIKRLYKANALNVNHITKIKKIQQRYKNRLFIKMIYIDNEECVNTYINELNHFLYKFLTLGNNINLSKQRYIHFLKHNQMHINYIKNECPLESIIQYGLYEHIIDNSINKLTLFTNNEIILWLGSETYIKSYEFYDKVVEYCNVINGTNNTILYKREMYNIDFSKMPV